MQKCFIIMPFGGYFDGYYTHVIKPALTNLHIDCVRGDEIYGTGVILNDIYDAICNANFCIADVTDRNPNVNYELGMAHAIGKPTIIITQKIEDVPFDYKHLRLIKYDPKLIGWEKIFNESVAKTIKELVANPDAQKILNSKFLQTTKSERDLIRKHIENIFFNQSYDLDRINRIYLENESCTIKTLWKGISKSVVYHLCHNIVCDLPGQLQVNKAYDRLNARDMDCFITVKEPHHLTYYFIFKQFKNVGQPFEAETEVLSPGYLDLKSLIETGEALMTTQALAHGFRYIKKEDWIYFPKKEEFSKVIGEYISHPNPDFIGKQVNLEESGQHYILKLQYGSGDPYQQETAAKIILK